MSTGSRETREVSGTPGAGGCRISRTDVASELHHGLDRMFGGEYFEAHESFENAWRAADPAEKDFFQGLVHVTVAWYQASRENRVGCERQLAKATRRLGPFTPEHRGVDVGSLLEQVDNAAERVARGSLELARLEEARR